MSFVEVNDPLWMELSSIATDEGLVLYDVEKVGRQSLRVFVEKDGSEVTDGLTPEQQQGSQAGVTSGDCSKLCQRLNVYLTAEGSKFGLSSDFELEVSSPGVNRNLRTIEQYRRALGERVKLVVGPGIELQKEHNGHASDTERVLPTGGTVVGTIRSADDSGLDVEDETGKGIYKIPYAELKRGCVEFKF